MGGHEVGVGGGELGVHSTPVEADQKEEERGGIGDLCACTQLGKHP